MKDKINHWVIGLSLLIILVQMAILFCWQFHADGQEQFTSELTSLNPVTATLFLLSACWLWINAKTGNVLFAHYSQYCIPLLLITCGITKLTAYAHWHHFAIDTLFFADKLNGRLISPVAALNFVLTGSAMLMGKKGKPASILSSLFILTILFLSFFSLCAAFISGDRKEVLSPFIPMVLVTSIIFSLLATGLILVMAKNNFLANVANELSGSLSFWKSIPVVVLLPLLLAFLRIKGQELHLYGTGFGVAMQATLMIFSLLFVAWRKALWINTKESEQKVTAMHLKASNQELEGLLLEVQRKDQTLSLLQELEFMMDAVPQIQWIAGRDGALQKCNKSGLEYTGKTKEDVLEWNWLPLLHPEDQGPCLEKWMAALRTGHPFDIEYRMQRASDGQFRWQLVRATPFKDENGAIQKWFGVTTDIHDIKLLQQELREKNQELLAFQNIAIDELKEKSQYLNGLTKNLPIIVYRLDGNGIVTESIGAGLKLMGMAEKTAIGLRTFEVYPHFIDRVAIALTQGFNMFVSEFEFQGTKVFFETYMFPDEYNPGGVVCFAIDVSQQKKGETYLIQAKEHAELANFHKSRFLSSMSHEIRTPLNGILGFAEVLKSSDLAREQQLQYLEQIESSGELLLKLIGDVLDLNKIEEGQLTLFKEKFHFSQSIKSAISPYKLMAKERGLEFTLLIDPDIPEFLIGDQNRLCQILINLIGNSFKFTEHGTISITFTWNRSLPEQEGTVALECIVQDSGIGIPEEKLQTIFESFTQADQSITKQFGGSGLGLTIVKQLVTLMGGTIQAKIPKVPLCNKGKKGSLFHFIIPFEMDYAQEGCSKSIDHSGPHFDFSQVNILAAEDNEVNAMLLSHLLKSLGCNYTMVDNGQAVLEQLLENDFDLVLMDVNMPKMDGVTATTIIRSRLDLKLPIVALTASSFREDVDRCTSAGMNDFVSKPFKIETIKKTIITWCSRASVNEVF
ncbi:PAS domain S-box-containing protein [Cnuella takakiae]|uniref:histidine kinase n=1 Tax=Cnuella takakiae TaxID=1302690 RepID=A0A1M4ZA16_9BACT|nr:PAS domain-containing hybrid sensor histidine kinase/response regulator [Cnuella takakiae]SHF14903.1 PAS domain S-box-containing protein [Cnuella takakiae]